MIWRRNAPSTAEVDKPKGFDDFELRLGDLMRGERATLGKSLLDVQRELKIKATYIAAIENCDTSAFESQGFIAGYIRSYSRYLGMDPEWAYQKFCAEANFTLHHGMSAGASPQRPVPKRGSEFRDPLADPNAKFIPRGKRFGAEIDLRAVGSVLVLAALIGGIGYGGWSVLQEVQRVQLAPVNQAPDVVAEMDPLSSVEAGGGLAIVEPEKPQGDLMGRLYRPQAQALDVPVLVARDGPIAAIDPRRPGSALQRAGDPVELAEAEMFGPHMPEGMEVPQVVAAAAPAVEILAVRPSWVRVQSADGTVLFEKILEAGERYEVPQMEAPAVLRAGNSGSVYFAVNGKAYGPAASGAQVVKNVALTPDALTGKYAVADLTGDADLARYVTADAGE
ncbi:helix-turn-helix domain-containing protein [Falsirhodobacter xinxiangensis]|uniref:helix-turn-helix domain-containing protein n=1 Tax=Falsirhodobacter xinxiangensis TaxID=2530049 RepID=UPI0010A9DF09|nr:helix-turn-helix domain-containing protein [Rhodobacter xinxiangensis]